MLRADFLKWDTDTYQVLVKTSIWPPLIDNICYLQVMSCCSVLKLDLLKLRYPG